MAIEFNLPENAAKRIEDNVTKSQAQTAKFNNALWHVRQALTEISGRMPLFATDEVTLQQLRVVVKCLEADQQTAVRYEQSAYRIYCEANGLDPNEEAEQDEAGELRKAALSRGRA